MKALLNALSSFFGNRSADKDSVSLLSSDSKIVFSDSSKRIFNVFFTLITVCTVCSMLGIILYYVYAFAAMYNGSSNFDWLLGIFSDFVEIMNFSLKESPYLVDSGSSYPPLAIAILYPFALICKDVFAKHNYSHTTIDELTADVVLSPQFWVAILLFFAICSLLTVFLASRLFGLRGKNALKLSVIILFSAPFVYAIMRGNTIYFALIFLLIFLILKNSKNPVAKEFSYLSLALAGAIKIYPLFFGVFLLKDKKIFASIRVGIYFFLIFGFSFFIFRNDIQDVSPFVDNLSGFMSNELRLLQLNNLSISAQLYKLIHGITPAVSSDSIAFTAINISILAIVFAVSTYAAIATKNSLSRFVICSAIVILIPPISYFYVIIFAILPFLEYIRNYNELNMGKRVFYFAAFLILFMTVFILPKNFILHSFTIISMLVIEIVSVIRERYLIKQQKKVC